MLVYTTSSSKDDLEGILRLQKANLAEGLPAEEIRSQGFVTVNHSYEQLKKLNDIEKHVIAKDDGKVVGYVLAMTQQSKDDIPVLIPMFEMFGRIAFGGKNISSYHYLVVGQVCVDKACRGQGVFDQCYSIYKNFYKDKYDFAITEIASANARSRQAHRRVGFKEIGSYVAPDNTEWIVVIWNWA
jgi:L-amino acid N-acyltransferase YncA